MTGEFPNHLFNPAICQRHPKRIIMMIPCNIQTMYCNRFTSMERNTCSYRPWFTYPIMEKIWNIPIHLLHSVSIWSTFLYGCIYPRNMLRPIQIQSGHYVTIPMISLRMTCCLNLFLESSRHHPISIMQNMISHLLIILLPLIRRSRCMAKNIYVKIYNKQNQPG